MSLKEEFPLLLGCLIVGFVAYHGSKFVKKVISRSKKDDFIPIGIVKSLYIYPLKSGKYHKVFSFFCGLRGPIIGELKDRQFQLIEGNTGNFISARQKPQIILVKTNVENGQLHIEVPGHDELIVDLTAVRKRADVRRTIWKGLAIDAFDCGPEISKLLSEFLKEENIRLVMFDERLHNERICRGNPDWWPNNPMPEREDRVTFQDFLPYMIQTESSLADLNSKLKDPIEQVQLRPVIVVDKCPTWDEDKWSEIRIGDVEIQCYRPCSRCVLTTINPSTGRKHPEVEPLKTLRTYRLGQEGVMRQEFKDSPIFGICGAIFENKTGFIHEGQVVYARYKPYVF